MLFLLAFTVLTFSHVLIFTAAIKADGPAPEPAKFLHTFSCVIISFTCWDIFRLSGAAPGGVAGDAWNSVPLDILLLGLASGWAFGLRFRRSWAAGARSFNFDHQVNIFCILAGLYMVGTAIDHMVFFHEKERAGVANAVGMGVSSIQCDQMVVVHITDEDAVYRCPKSIALGVGTAAPFVPWPSYTEGHSVELKRTLERLSQNAIRLDHGVRQAK